MKKLMEAYLAEKDLMDSGTADYGLLFAIPTPVPGTFFVAYTTYHGEVKTAAMNSELGEVAGEDYAIMQAVNEGIIPELQYLAAKAVEWEQEDKAIVGELGRTWAKNWRLSGFLSDQTEKLPWRAINLMSYPYPELSELIAQNFLWDFPVH